VLEISSQINSDEFAHGLSNIEQKLWASGGIGNGGVHHVDFQIVVDRAEDFLHIDGTFGSMLTQPVGRSNRLSCLHTATDQPGAMLSLA
jgi:hypothetical protein